MISKNLDSLTLLILILLIYKYYPPPKPSRFIRFTNLSICNSEGSYIQTDIDLSSLSTTEKNSYLEDRDIGVTFRTNVSYAGNYTFKLFTPGCIYDDSCDNRAIVNASLHGGDGSIITSELIYQTNNQRKYDIIFNGYITDDILLQGMPYVSMSLNSQLYSTQNSINLVADSLQVDFLKVN
ncbi:unnamed protein product [[Candida] boidinii]|nr:unnamed protein product [[Candida] boidinii]